MGIEVARSKEGIGLSQRKYVMDILEENGFLGSKPMEAPMNPNVKLYKDQGELCLILRDVVIWLLNLGRSIPEHNRVLMSAES